ncbi:unnamed protein product [Caenorhabditis bovis]|uniref:INTS8 TPR repeats domain-containing protein n=1 Tax=Caenorhabditis bovis TaxID=2654633 RepID=A0A8S1F6J4_9PELO|nr:unnamed protein product [Caenorhabditis bovis]
MMQYDAKMDVMDTSDHTWFECFIDPVKARKVLRDPAMKKILPRLCIQFTEKGFLAEKEREKIGKLAIEELNLFDRKAASMRLCAMAAFSALDWDIDYIIDNVSRYELLTLRVLADYTYKIYNEKNLDATFGNWLFYRFVISIDRRSRIPPPAPKATIPTLYNQMTMNDLSYIRHEKVQKMIAELRTNLPKARAFITELSEQPKDVIAPGVECFLQPFATLAPRALSAALIGNRDVLIEIPECNFDIEKFVLPADDVANKCRAELVSLLFTCGELREAKRIMSKIHRPKIAHKMTSIDETMLKAYSMVLNVKSPFVTGSTLIKPMVFDQKVLLDDNSPYRKSELFRERGEQETSGQLQMVYKSENAAKSIFDGHPESVREKVSSKATIERFVKVLKRHLSNLGNDVQKKIFINGYLQFLCATIVDLRPTLERSGFDVSQLRDIAKPSPSTPLQPLPTSQMIDALVQNSDPFWIIVTKFNLETLRDAMTEMGPFWFPNTMPHSEFLDDIVKKSKSSPNHNLQRLLLAKLEQLSKMRNFKAFTTRLQEYFAEMGGSAQWVLQATFESIHVHAAVGNHCCFLPYERKFHEVNVEQTSLIFKPDFKPTENSAKMINQCMALLLNRGEFKTVLEKGGHIPIEQFPCVPVARLLGAYAHNISDQAMTRKCADGFSHTNSVKFTAIQKKDSKFDIAKRDIAHLLHLFNLIRQPLLVEFILAYIVSVHNRAVSTQNRPQLKLHAKLLPLFGNENTPIELSNAEDVRQCLRMMCEKAYKILRADADAIRTYADFLYVEGDYQAAGEKYMEYFAAHSINFKINGSADAVFNETLIRRLRVILANSGYMTMSYLLCQFIKNGKLDEMNKAASINEMLLQKNMTRDIGANLAEFIIDTQFIETLSGHYHSLKMSKAVSTLYSGASTLASNKSVPGPLIVQEVHRRTAKFIQTLASIFFGIHC